MASSRDDFIIAIRSAFLKKSTKQKISLLTLVLLSISIIILSSLNIKPIKQLRIIINELVYRSTFIVSIPENLIKNSYVNILEYSNFYKDYKNNKEELDKLKSENITSEIIKSENKELKNLIEDYSFTTNKILAKVIVDHESPFLKTLIINKGSAEQIKIGTNIYDKSYLIGRVIEVNYKTSRVLLLSDLNSSIPVTITPGNIQAIVVGSGENLGEIKYVKGNLVRNIENQSIVYTSGTGSLFRSGSPIGRISKKINENESEKIEVIFYSDFDQLKYVFAEVDLNKIDNSLNNKKIEENVDILENSSTTEKIKLDLLNDEIEIYKESNTKFIEENKELRLEINQLENNYSQIKEELNSLKASLEQKNFDQKEIEFLRLNLIHSSKCARTIFNNGFKIGTEEYKNCILSKGKITND